MDVKQAAEQLGIHPSTVRRWIRSGKIRATAYRDGSAIRYDIHPQSLRPLIASVMPDAVDSDTANTDDEAAKLREAAKDSDTDHRDAPVSRAAGTDRMDGWMRAELAKVVQEALRESAVSGLVEAFNRFALEHRQWRVELMREIVELKARVAQLERKYETGWGEVEAAVREVAASLAQRETSRPGVHSEPVQEKATAASGSPRAARRRMKGPWWLRW